MNPNASSATSRITPSAGVLSQATAAVAPAEPGGVGAGENAGTGVVAATSEKPAQAQAAATQPAPPAEKMAVAQVGTPAPRSPADTGSIGGAMFALVFVIGLILGLAWLARRIPGFRGTTGNPALRVVGSLALSPRERVVVVAVGETQLVLGVGASGTRTLHTLAAPLPAVAPDASPAFAQLLAQHFGKKA